MLEPGWSDSLARRARLGPVIVLLGFPDRSLVAEARIRGASACLELPVDLADLANTLDRLAAVQTQTVAASGPRKEPPHPTPPPPAALWRDAARLVEPRREP